MTPTDKQAIAEYMGCDEFNRPISSIAFDLNDAGLCVKEMVRRGEWNNFMSFCAVEHDTMETHILFAHCMEDAQNFFELMSEWLRGRQCKS